MNLLLRTNKHYWLFLAWICETRPSVFEIYFVDLYKTMCWEWQDHIITCYNTTVLAVYLKQDFSSTIASPLY